MAVDIKYAYIFVQSVRNYYEVKLDKIINFNAIEFLSKPENKRSKMVFKANVPDNKEPVKCQIVATAETKKALQKLITNKRPVCPKLNESAFDSNEEEATGRSNYKFNPKMHNKVMKDLRGNTLQSQSDDIIKSYMKNLSNEQKPENRKRNRSESPHVHSNDGTKKPVITSPKNKIVKFMRSTQNDVLEHADEESLIDQKKSIFGVTNSSNADRLQEKISEMGNQLKKKECELAEMREYASICEEKYKKLKESKAYLLTEETGKQILRSLNFIEGLNCRPANDIACSTDVWSGNGTLPNTHISNTNLCSSVKIEKEVVNLQNADEKDDKRVYLDNDVWVTKNAYCQLNEITNPSKCIGTLAIGVWGAEKLANRVVKRRKGVNRKPLTPTKRGAIMRVYAKWLAQIGCTGKIMDKEIDAANAYFGRAITQAQRMIMGGEEENTAKRSNCSKVDPKSKENNSHEDKKTNVSTILHHKDRDDSCGETKNDEMKKPYQEKNEFKSNKLSKKEESESDDEDSDQHEKNRQYDSEDTIESNHNSNVDSE